MWNITVSLVLNMARSLHTLGLIACALKIGAGFIYYSGLEIVKGMLSICTYIDIP